MLFEQVVDPCLQLIGRGSDIVLECSRFGKHLRLDDIRLFDPMIVVVGFQDILHHHLRGRQPARVFRLLLGHFEVFHMRKRNLLSSQEGRIEPFFFVHERKKEERIPVFIVTLAFIDRISQ